MKTEINFHKFSKCVWIFHLIHCMNPSLCKVRTVRKNMAMIFVFNLFPLFDSTPPRKWDLLDLSYFFLLIILCKISNINPLKYVIICLFLTFSILIPLFHIYVQYKLKLGLKILWINYQWLTSLYSRKYHFLGSNFSLTIGKWSDWSW